MGKHNQEKVIHECASLEGWERAICEAQNQITAAKEKIGRLELSVKTFEEMRDRAEPWPGDFESSHEYLQAEGDAKACA